GRSGTWKLAFQFAVLGVWLLAHGHYRCGRAILRRSCAGIHRTDSGTRRADCLGDRAVDTDIATATDRMRTGFAGRFAGSSRTGTTLCLWSSVVRSAYAYQLCHFGLAAGLPASTGGPGHPDPDQSGEPCGGVRVCLWPGLGRGRNRAGHGRCGFHWGASGCHTVMAQLRSAYQGGTLGAGTRTHRLAAADTDQWAYLHPDGLPAGHDGLVYSPGGQTG